MTDWRDDPGWRLAEYDPAAYPNGAPAKPTPAAELAQPPIWASEIHGSRAVATWARIDTRLDA